MFFVENKLEITVNYNFIKKPRFYKPNSPLLL